MEQCLFPHMKLKLRLSFWSISLKKSKEALKTMSKNISDHMFYERLLKNILELLWTTSKPNISGRICLMHFKINKFHIKSTAELRFSQTKYSELAFHIWQMHAAQKRFINNLYAVKYFPVSLLEFDKCGRDVLLKCNIICFVLNKIPTMA